MRETIAFLLTPIRHAVLLAAAFGSLLACVNAGDAEQPALGYEFFRPGVACEYDVRVTIESVGGEKPADQDVSYDLAGQITVQCVRAEDKNAREMLLKVRVSNLSSKALSDEKVGKTLRETRGVVLPVPFTIDAEGMPSWSREEVEESMKNVASAGVFGKLGRAFLVIFPSLQAKEVTRDSLGDLRWRMEHPFVSSDKPLELVGAAYPLAEGWVIVVGDRQPSSPQGEAPKAFPQEEGDPEAGPEGRPSEDRTQIVALYSKGRVQQGKCVLLHGGKLRQTITVLARD